MQLPLAAALKEIDVPLMQAVHGVDMDDVDIDDAMEEAEGGCDVVEGRVPSDVDVGADTHTSQSWGSRRSDARGGVRTRNRLDAGRI
jgi:hypothetical protein